MAKEPQRLEPRWPAVLALLAVSALQLAIPKSLAVGPAWSLMIVVVILLIPTIWARKMGQHSLNQILGRSVTAIVTADMVWSLGLLVRSRPTLFRSRWSPYH